MNTNWKQPSVAPLSAIRAENWETLNRTLLSSARQEKARGWSHGAAGQHGHRGVVAPTQRQQPIMGCGADDGPSVLLAWRHRRCLAQS